MTYKPLFLLAALTLSIFLLGCVNKPKAKKKITIDTNTSDIKIDNCKLYGHKDRVDGFSGATILIEEASNKKEKIIKEILNRSDLNKIQFKITEKESKDFIAISICDFSKNPFPADCIIDNYYNDSLLFKVEIDTVKMIYKKI